jgi:alpha-galactosidase
MVDYGLKDLGYHYVILDDCWSVGRDAATNNSLIPNPQKFPQGMAAVADAVHALDLGFGMYSSAGKFTCGGFPGSLGFETIDAETWAGLFSFSFLLFLSLFIYIYDTYVLDEIEFVLRFGS